MSITQTPVKYQTSDGRKFDTPEEAERHEKLAQAREEFEVARRKLGKALAETQKTADGKPFDFGTWRRFWYVTPGYDGMPALREVEFSRFDFDFDDHDDVFEIRQTHGGDLRRYRISDLYHHRGKAEAALLSAQEQWLAERAEEVEETRARVRGPS